MMNRRRALQFVAAVFGAVIAGRPATALAKTTATAPTKTTVVTLTIDGMT